MTTTTTLGQVLPWPADKHSQRHAFINSPSICYLADVAAIAEAVKVQSRLSTKPAKIQALKPSKFQPATTSRSVFLKQMIEGQASW